MKKLSRDEMKNVMGGLKEQEGGCGTGISCDGKNEGDTCGTKTCCCATVDTTSTLYCRTDCI